MKLLDATKTPTDIAKSVADRIWGRRKDLKLTQVALAEKSGVSYGSIKRFERTGEVSLSSLIKIAIALDCEDDFDALFEQRGYASIEEVINARKNASR